MVYVQLGQILDQKTKIPTAISEEPGAKTGCREQNSVLGMPPALNTTKGWANRLSHPSSLTPTLTPYKEWACPPCPSPALGSKGENVFLVFAPSCSWHRNPNKALPEFLVTFLRGHNFPDPRWEEALLQVTPQGLVTLLGVKSIEGHREVEAGIGPRDGE